MKNTTQFKFDTAPATDQITFPEPITNPLKLKPTSFPLKKLPFWRVLFLLIGGVILTFLIGYPLAGILVAIGYGFLLEKAIVNNAYFGGLDNRIFTDAAGKNWLEVTRKQTMDKFLDTELRLTVTNYAVPALMGSNYVLFDETVIPRNVARRQGDSYLIPLPMPPAGVGKPAAHDNTNLMEWRLDWLHPRQFVYDIGYVVALQLTKRDTA